MRPSNAKRIAAATSPSRTSYAVTSIWKRAWISAEVAARVAAPVSHPALEEAHLEPAMTPTQASQEMDRQQRVIELEEAQWQQERDRAAAFDPNAGPTRDAHGTVPPPKPKAEVCRAQGRTTAAPQRRAETATAPAPARTREPSRD